MYLLLSFIKKNSIMTTYGNIVSGKELKNPRLKRTCNWLEIQSALDSNCNIWDIFYCVSVSLSGENYTFIMQYLFINQINISIIHGGMKNALVDT